MQKKHTFYFSVQTLIVFFLTINSYAQFSGGVGSINDPFIISTLEDLRTLSENNLYWGDNFQLSQNIDATDTKNWNAGEGFSSIGNLSQIPFSGSFNGSGYHISSLYINNTSLIDVGFFGYIQGAQIYNLGLVNVDITDSLPSTYIGGLAGRIINSTITHCYVQGSVTSTNFSNAVGGLASTIDADSNIEESYAFVSVKADVCGGLVGDSAGHISDCWVGGSVDGSIIAGGLTYSQSGTIKRSYSIAQVIDSGNYGFVGGFCAYTSGIEEDCFFDATLSQQTNAFQDGNNRNVISLNTADFANPDYFSDANWNMNDTWKMMSFPIVDTHIRPYLEMPLINRIEAKANPTLAATVSGSGYYELGDLITLSYVALPLHTFKGWKRNGVIESTNNPYTFNCTGNETIEAIFELDTNFSGSGTIADPYQIATINDLQDIANFPSLYEKNYILTSDIDASETRTWNGGKGFLPIGSAMYPFTGNLNGNHHIISGLYINQTSEEATGLFGYTQTANIAYMGLEDCAIYGGDNTGAIIGKDVSASSINNVFIEGLVTGNDTVGGFIGTGVNSKLELSYSLAKTYGRNNVGGLVGFISGNEFYIDDAYAAEFIYSEGFVGGVVSSFSGNGRLRGFYDVSTTGLGYDRGTSSGDNGTYDFSTSAFSNDLHVNTYFDMVNQWQLAYGRDNKKRPILKWEASFTASFSNDGNGYTKIEEAIVISGNNLPSVYATPNTGYTFSHWLNEDTGEIWTTNPLIITELDHDYNIKAIFTPNTGTHQVTFNLLYNGSPIYQNFLLEWNNNYYDFDSNGQVILTNVPDGNHAYTVENADRVFTVSGNDVIENIEIADVLYISENRNYNFLVLDDENLIPIANAEIALGSTTIETDSNGAASIQSYYGTKYAINATNYTSANGTASSNSFINIFLKPNYSIELEVTDGTQLIKNANVLLDGKTYISDSQGKIMISEVTSGSYSMLISASGYTTINHTVTIANNNVSETITLVPATAPTRTINFKVDNGLEYVSNALIIITLQDTVLGLTTNENGEVSVILEEGTYPLRVSASFFSVLEQNLVVSGIDEQIDITLTSSNTEYTSYNVFDVDYNAVPNATLTTENGTVFSFDSNSSLSIQNLALGNTYHFTISAPGFKDKSITKTIDGIYIHAGITLYQSTDLKIICTDGVNPLQNVEFNFNNKTYISDSQGEILISDLTYQGIHSPIPYAYTAQKEGYYPISGGITLDNLNGNVENLIFTQNPIPNHEISFKVEDEVANPLTGAKVNINRIMYTTETNGLVNIGKLPDGSYPYTVSADGFTLYRGTLVISGNDVIELVQLETTTASTTDYIISGVLLDDGSLPLSNVTITGFPNLVTTDVNGEYTTTVPSKWSGTITAQLTDYTFSPENYVFNNITSNQNQIDFIGKNTTLETTPVPVIKGAFFIAPNPSIDGEIVLYFETNTFVKNIKVFNSNASLVKEITINETKEKVILTHAVSRGLYLVIVETNKGLSINKVIVH
ncbi:InlB B-repeat-containing protein [Flavivirga jejuensis]|uniref:T9SS type A sorting domain-containing protein n=1 Tax=Flavivirga jejuensis TaxID=870487 RepID=A0ABT8WL09_9FLAO|nr:T9SS type A sorting domain-containing protein [Flavivirga jejuensis]MDO5973674.1 T9SS type A sorting domain-containing protein [Flavivirga jejuensis]